MKNIWMAFMLVIAILCLFLFTHKEEKSVIPPLATASLGPGNADMSRIYTTPNLPPAMFFGDPKSPTTWDSTSIVMGTHKLSKDSRGVLPKTKLEMRSSMDKSGTTEQCYINDIPQGPYLMYYPSGEIQTQGQLMAVVSTDGSWTSYPCGLWKTYDKSGRLKREIFYASDDEGMPIESAYYEREYYESGKILSTVTLKGEVDAQGKPFGGLKITTTYAEDGAVLTVTTVQSHTGAGVKTTYYPSGSLKSRFTYRYDLERQGLTGTTEHFNESGELTGKTDTP